MPGAQIADAHRLAIVGVVRFWSERVFVVLPDTHALCAKDAIAWDDLRNETFILSRSDPGMAIHDYVI